MRSSGPWCSTAPLRPCYLADLTATRRETSCGGSRQRTNGKRPDGRHNSADLPPLTGDFPIGAFFVAMPDGDPTEPAKPDLTAYAIASYIEAPHMWWCTSRVNEADLALLLWLLSGTSTSTSGGL